MKKSIFTYLFAILSVAIFTTSCGGDNEPSFPIEKEIAGTYKGVLEISIDGAVIAVDLPKNITISRASDVAVNMELKDFSFLGIDLGTIILKNCAVSQNGSSYSFTSEQTLELDEVGPCPTKVSGTVNGTQTVVNLDIIVTNQNNLKVKVVYTGSRLAGDEKTEAAITSFTFDNKVAANSVVVTVPVIDEAKKTITFMVADAASAEDLKALVPTIVVSDKATLIPGSDVAQNFGAPVVYTVVAENGKESKYTASISNTVCLRF